MTEFKQANTQTTFQPASWGQRLLPLVVGGLVLLLDQATKAIVEATIPFNTSWAPIPWLAPVFQFTHTGNTGIAFGLFAGGSALFAIVAAIVTVIIIFYNFTLPAGSVGLRLALGLLLGGAVGNLLDRLRLGHVTDFLDFGPWPIFNVADTAVVVGALALAWLMWQDARTEASSAADTAVFSPTADE